MLKYFFFNLIILLATLAASQILKYTYDSCFIDVY